MKKRVLCGLLLLTALAAAMYFWWPMSFESLMSECTEIRAVRIDNGIPLKVTCNEAFPAGSETFEAIRSVLERYSYHHSLQSLTGDGALEGNHVGYWLQLYLDTGAEPVRIACGGAGEISVGGRVYRLGYGSDGATMTFMEEIAALLP